MDEYSSKKTVGGVAAARKGSGLVLRDTADSRDGNAQFCNRLGCSGRLNYSKGARIECLEKPKSPRPSFRSSCGKEVTGSSSRTFSSGTNAKKCIQESQKKLSSKLEADSSSNSGRDESVVQNASSRRFYTDKPEARETKSNKVALMEVGKLDLVASNPRTRKVYRQKFGLANRDTQIGSSSVSPASEITGQGPRETTNTGRYCLKHISCNSTSDVLTQGDSYSESNNGRRKDIVKKRFTEGESSSYSRGKNMTGLSSEKGRSSLSAGGISISDTRRTRNGSVCRESGVSSIRTRRPVNGNTMRGCLNPVNGNNPSLTESPIPAPHMSQPEKRWLSGETSSSGSSFNGSHNTTDSLSSMMPLTSNDLSITHLMSCGGTRPYNIDGIADVLLALERIEQDEELMHEQLLSLEANLFLGGLNLYDQHRDMRLDIDSMSYEELLALEEEMGTVSTALSEEALSKCLRISMYQPFHSKEWGMGCSGDVDEIKCSICQEEFVTGDEIGRLGCEHGYHSVCINQWLRLKNWCPVCKGSAQASNSSSLS